MRGDNCDFFDEEIAELPPDGDDIDSNQSAWEEIRRRQNASGQPPLDDLHPNHPDNNQPPPHGADRAHGKPLPFTKFDDIGTFTAKRWIMKGLIARGETSNWIGPPGSGKSSIVDDIVIYCTQAIEWHGHRAKEACGALIIALERGDLHKRRLAAYRKRDGLKSLPIVVANCVIDLMDTRCIDTIVATVMAAESACDHPFGIIVIDTYNKGIAAGGGDEDKAKDQNRVAANLRRLQEKLDVHILTVGHTGKDETRRGRGSNAPEGDADVVVQISVDGPVKTAKVIKANDQPERELLSFKLEPVELDHDEDGDPINVAVIRPIAVEERIGQAAAKRAKRTRMPASAQIALDALVELIGEQGMARWYQGLPPHVKAVTIDQWRSRALKRGISDSGPEAAAKAFKRAFDTLNAGHFIGVANPYVWKADR